MSLYSFDSWQDVLKGSLPVGLSETLTFSRENWRTCSCKCSFLSTRLAQTLFSTSFVRSFFHHRREWHYNIYPQCRKPYAFWSKSLRLKGSNNCLSILENFCEWPHILPKPIHKPVLRYVNVSVWMKISFEKSRYHETIFFWLLYLFNRCTVTKKKKNCPFVSWFQD